MTQAAWCWLLWPIIGAVSPSRNLRRSWPSRPSCPCSDAFLMGMAYGVGGTAFNISIRYIGFSLTYAIAVGLSSVLGTLVTPLAEGRFGEILGKPGGGWVMAGVAVGVLGIAMCGLAGRLKELDFRDQQRRRRRVLAGQGTAPVAGGRRALGRLRHRHQRRGQADHRRRPNSTAPATGRATSPTCSSTPGPSSPRWLYSLCLARKNRSLGELTAAAARAGSAASLAANYVLAMLTGTLWYGQFFFYNLGHVRMGHYKFTSWAIHMIMLVLFSNLVGVLFREWKGCRPRTRWRSRLALLVLLAAVLLLTYGNYLGDQV